ncbi:MAG TPA: efflux RND transporter periplasmic adaptor subunit [Tenuifilaceae bacterium]|nr:efflux RND transporter periplasmic adaptor subunit [Tenuifilaceae bacterium]HPE18536.1 efflux RND transporter periplasmic adaptor subunit [Tenuifilaceae bacterium]HPJ45924.1 efflux RND transporter periplasmic adaptor subunit [Tenuifilaceae bacterium]HPQ35016.1 efflux RND transporter periplasmic adaptor subunit [Tenuifilaceae bacterium]HRX67335.1 efflux RND transporter periplasmic adaptor subunit [Tenuifilaceae bacterium]
MISKYFRLIAVFALTTGLLAGCNESNSKSSTRSNRARSGLEVEAIVVDLKPLSQGLLLSGTLLAGEEVELKAETTGKLVEFHLDEGRSVVKGQLLARVNDSEVRARLEKLKSDLKLAQDDLERKQRLKDIDALSQQDLDVAVNRVDGIKADIRLAEAQIEKAEIRAPFDGTIGLRNVSPGSFIGSTTVLATLIQDDPLRLEFSVPERYAYGVNIGKEVTFTLGHYPTQYKATIYATESVIDPQTRALRVRAKCINTERKLIPGSFARVSLNINGNVKTMLIPPHALVPVLGGQNVVISKEGKAKFVEVETGVRTATAVEVVSGIQPGDTLLISGLLQVREGTPVSTSIVDGW